MPMAISLLKTCIWKLLTSAATHLYSTTSATFTSTAHIVPRTYAESQAQVLQLERSRLRLRYYQSRLRRLRRLRTLMPSAQSATTSVRSASKITRRCGKSQQVGINSARTACPDKSTALRKGSMTVPCAGKTSSTCPQARHEVGGVPAKLEGPRNIVKESQYGARQHVFSKCSCIFTVHESELAITHVPVKMFISGEKDACP